MWIIITLGIIAIVCLIAVTSIKNTELGAIVIVIGALSIFALTVTASLCLYNRGKAVILGNMPYSLSQETVYTVTAVTNGFAIITNERQEGWALRLNKDLLHMWLVELSQTNVVVGKKYIIIDNSKHTLESDKNQMIFMEVNP